MTKDQVLSAVRHTLTFLGGFAVAKGFVDATGLTEIVGALVTLIGAVWGVLSKKTAPATEAK